MIPIGFRATSPVLLPALLALLGSVACAPVPPPVGVDPTPVEAAPAPPLPFAGGLAEADTFVVRTVAPGVRHLSAWDAGGPWAVDVLEVDRAVCTPELRAVKAGPPLSVRAPASVLLAEALGGVNADFFMLPGGTPVGLHVTGGATLAGPATRPAFGSGPAGFAVGTGRVRGHAWERTDSMAIDQVNRPLSGRPHQPPPETLTLFTIWSDTLPAEDGPAPTVVMNVLEGDARAGRGRVVAVWENLSMLLIRPGEVALRGRGSAGAWLLDRELHDTLHWSSEAALLTEDGVAVPVTEAVGGFPELLRDGAVVLDGAVGVSTAFGAARHPRTAVAWDAPGNRLLLVTVDGRQPGYSAGMTLRELTALLLRLGATDALNLDGGGSTAMVVGGTVVNRPSDDLGERSVGNALALAACPVR